MKPDLRFSDAINNDVEIVTNAEHVLIYDRPVGSAGITWNDLQSWWADHQGIPNDDDAKKSLYRRLPTTEKFPKKVRPTLTNRIDTLALDVAMTLTQAQYTKSPAVRIREANLLLTKLRILLRLSHKMAYLPHKPHEHASRKIDEVGRMLGAWGKAEV